MKKLLIVSACVAALSSGMVLAEEGQGGHHGKKASPEQRLERMRTHLDLTDAQVEEVREIHAAGGRREEIRAVLTEEQQAKMAEARKKHHKRKGEQPDAQGEGA